MTLEDIQLYLPKFLSAESKDQLFDGLKNFPSNIDTRLYTNNLEGGDIVYQGDGLKDLLVINLPDTSIGNAPSMVLSNTCDIDIENKRPFNSRIIYSPIFNLKKYSDKIRESGNKTDEQLNSHIESIKKQEITQIFYLPPIDGKLDESFVFFDRINNCHSNYIKRDELGKSRIFTLSNYGIYLFLFKLSIHFTRIQDGVDRAS